MTGPQRSAVWSTARRGAELDKLPSGLSCEEAVESQVRSVVA